MGSPIPRCHSPNAMLSGSASITSGTSSSARTVLPPRRPFRATDIQPPKGIDAWRRCSMAAIGTRGEAPVAAHSSLPFAELVVDELGNRRQRLLGLRPPRLDLDRAAFAGGEHHQPHDALAVHRLIVLADRDLD